MQKDYNTKVMKAEEAKTKRPTQQFHFSGGTLYEPMTVEAESQEEADRLYEVRKVPVKN